MTEKLLKGYKVGDMTYMRLLVTHIVTVKNEGIVIPNSVILSSRVINYSPLANVVGESPASDFSSCTPP